MQINLKPGKYVVAVSGGVDSMVLLNILSRLPDEYQFVVAHFDHGIRPDSAEDRKLVEASAKAYRLPFVYEEAKLGPKTSEATARTARYKFLEKVREESGSDAIITAHHQDDVLETAIMNIQRGTNRKGLASLTSRPGILRPLLDVPKQEVIDYAVLNKLSWREDSTNQDLAYKRNYIRHKIMPKLNLKKRETLAGIIDNQTVINAEIDSALQTLLNEHINDDGLDRQWLVSLDDSVAREVLAAWLRERSVSDFDRKTLERMLRAAHDLRPGNSVDVKGGVSLRIGRDRLALTGSER